MNRVRQAYTYWRIMLQPCLYQYPKPPGEPNYVKTLGSICFSWPSDTPVSTRALLVKLEEAFGVSLPISTQQIEDLDKAALLGAVKALRLGLEQVETQRRNKNLGTIGYLGKKIQQLTDGRDDAAREKLLQSDLAAVARVLNKFTVGELLDMPIKVRDLVIRAYGFNRADALKKLRELELHPQGRNRKPPDDVNLPKLPDWNQSIVRLDQWNDKPPLKKGE
jgi:hypothetical protein